MKYGSSDGASQPKKRPTRDIEGYERVPLTLNLNSNTDGFMPYITVGKENSGDIDLYYEDHGTGQPVDFFAHRRSAAEKVVA